MAYRSRRGSSRRSYSGGRGGGFTRRRAARPSARRGSSRGRSAGAGRQTVRLVIEHHQPSSLAPMGLGGNPAAVRGLPIGERATPATMPGSGKADKPKF